MEGEYHNRLDFMLRDTAEALRRVFMQRWLQKNNTHWQNTPQQLQQLLSNPYIADFAHSLHSKTKQKFLSGNVDNWELPLLVKVLTSVDLSTSSTRESNQEQNKKIQKLTQIRNHLAHNAQYQVISSDFEQFCGFIEDVLVSIGEPIESVEKLKYAPLSELISTTQVNPEIMQKAAQLKKEGNDYFAKGAYDQAIQIYTEAIHLQGVSQSERATLFSNRAASYLKRNTNEAYLNALNDAKKAVELWPNWAKGHIRKGIAYSRLGQYEKAIRAYDNAIALEPKNAEFVQLRAEAMDLYRSLQRGEHLDAKKNMEDHFSQFSESFGKQMDTTTIKQMIKTFKKSDPGMHDLLVAHCFLHGMAGYAQDDRRALELFSSAAKAGVAEAMYYMGYMARYGRGQPKDPAAAIVWWKKTIKEPALKSNGQPNTGVAEAEHSLGNAYMDGVGVNKDINKALAYFEASAEHGFEGGLNNLGTLYEHGQGVPRDMKKAMEYYTAAAMKGAPLGMYNLGMMYASGDAGKKDINKAKMWLQRAAEAGFQTAELELQKLENFLEDNPNYGNDNIDLTEQMNKFNIDPKLKKPLEKVLQDVTQPKSGFSRVHSADSNLQKMATCLEEYSDRSTFAKLLWQAFELFIGTLGIILQQPKTTPQTDRKILSNIAKCYSYPNGSLVAHWVPQALEKVSTIAERILSKDNTDEEAMICQLWTKLMMTGDPKWAVSYCSRLITAYPNNPIYYAWRGDLRALCQQYDRTVEDMNKAISMQQDPAYQVDLFFSRGSAKRMIRAEDSAIEDYNKFLQMADPYHRSRPDTYYNMAAMYMTRDKQSQMKRKKGSPSGPNLDIARQYFKKAKEAEKTQLPIFPSDSGAKNLVSALLEQEDDNEKPSINNNNNAIVNNNVISDNNNASSTSTGAQAKPKAVDPLKLDMMREQRQAMESQVQYIGMSYQALFKHASRHEQKMPKKLDLTTLRPITVEEMDPRKDKVYNGRILTGTLVESPMPMTGVHSIMQDDEGHCCRISFYNLDDSFKQNLLTKLGVGRRFSIVNPYLRIAADMKAVIRVDDPLTIIFLSPEDHRVCFTCQKSEEDAHLLNCSACKVAWYCSKECQATDWKTQNHKGICAYLKNFKQITTEKKEVITGTIPH